MHRAGNDLKMKMPSESRGCKLSPFRDLLETTIVCSLIFSSLPSESGKIKARSQFWIKRILELNHSFCVYVLQITFDYRVKEELGVGRDQIKMLSAHCSLQHLSEPNVCVRARAMFVTAGKQFLLKHNKEN